MSKWIKKIFVRLKGACYVMFFLTILFWICAGAGIFWVSNPAFYIFMGLLTLCEIIVLLSIVLLDRFYFNEVNEILNNLEKLNVRLRTQRHEYLNEMQVVYGLLELDEYEEAKRYLKPVYTDIATINKAMKTSKPAVNALLAAKIEASKLANASLYIEINSNLENLKMRQWDFCKIIGNLIDNAITAVSSNPGNRDIHVILWEDVSSIYLTVYNNGPMISKDKQALIFKRGYTSKKGEGHGFGLVIVKDIIVEANGSIEVESKENKTSFCVKLPKSEVVSK